MSEEIKEIVDKLSNRKQKTLIQVLRECQLKDIEHLFITKEEYIDKLLNYIKYLQQKVEQLDKEIDRLNNIINELENTIANFIKNHTESYIDWKYDREIYLAESNVLQKLFDNYLDKLKELKDSD